MNIEQQRIEAQNDNTTANRLVELAKNQDYLTRRYVTSNPNTPKQTLFNLGVLFPRELINNPIFDLFILEDINFVENMPLPTLIAILRQQDVPDFVYQGATNRAELETQLLLANKTDTSQDTLEKLTKSKYCEVRQVANLHINLAGELEDEYEEKGQKSIRKLFNCLKHSHLKVQKLQLLCEIVLLPDFIVEYLIYNGYYSILINMAKCIHSLPTVFEQIATYNKYQKKFKLTKQNFNLIRRNLAENPHLSTDTFYLLMKENKDSVVTKNLAENPRTPVDILKKLAKSQNKWVRYRVANNPNTSITVLEDLTKDKMSLTAKSAQKNILSQTNNKSTLLSDNYELKNSSQFSWQNFKEIISQDTYLFKNDHDRLAEVLNYYILSKCPLTRYVVLSQPQLSQERLTEATFSVCWSDRFAVSQNPNTPLDVLKKLAQDSNQLVRAGAKNNSSFSQ